MLNKVFIIDLTCDSVDFILGNKMLKIEDDCKILVLFVIPIKNLD